MALSDQLTKLAGKAKEAEDHAAAAETQARAELDQSVKTAQEAARTQADALRKSAEANKGKISAWWEGVQRSWDEHVAAIRQDFDERRAEHDVNAAQRAADRAEGDAAFAVDYAYGAIEEAEYAVLNAALARKDAVDLAAKS
jgi:hypothetical protein